MHRITSSTAVVLLASVLFAAPAFAQKRDVKVVTAPAALLTAPRGDGGVIGEVAAGSTLEILDKFQDWYLVNAPAGKGGTVSWQRGWIHSDAIQPPGGRRAAARQNGRLLVRGFGHGGGLRFAASDSFQAILGRSMNTVYGAGAQVVLPNGIFVQGSIDRVRETGNRALVSGTQVFVVDVPNRLTLTPMQISAGYRDGHTNAFATYFGGGVGWHTLEEDSPSIPSSEAISKRKLGYHVLGGVEYPLLRWVWIAGEAQWATVPKGLGETGVSAVFGEEDLGGVTFRVKFIVGY